MTDESSPNTNGRVRVEKQIAETREVLRGPAKSRSRRRLIVPAIVALGVIAVLRRSAKSSNN